MNVVYVFLTVIGLLTLLVPAVAIFRRSKKDKQKLKESFEKGVQQGRASAIEEMEKVREERGLGYREAALVVGKKCASCSRKCIHCAREESTQKEFDAAEAEDLYVHHVKEQERTAKKQMEES